MKHLDRDMNILEHIVTYCDQIQQTVERFGDDYNIFAADPIYRNAAALCILQIGELVGKLTEAFRERYSGAPWRQIKGMRNIVAHRYGTVDHAINWDVVEHDIPLLKTYCENLLRQDPSPEG